MKELLFIDTETGGLDPSVHSILSLGAVVWRDGQIGQKFEVMIREPVITITPDAMNRNGIDLRHFDEGGAVTPDEAVQKFERFISENLSVTDDSPRVTLVGHNVGFDTAFLKRLYAFTESSYDHRFWHRVIDTSSIAAVLILAGRIPIATPSTDLLFKHFEIDFAPKTRHTAQADAVATAELFNHLLSLVGESSNPRHA